MTPAEARNNDAGFSLMELVIVTMLMGLISILVTTFAISTWRDSVTVQTRINDVDQARIAIDATSKSVRTAVRPLMLQAACGTCTGPAATDPAVTAASDLGVQFYSNTGVAAGPDRVTYATALDPTRGNVAVFSETRQPPDTGSAPNFTYTTCTIGVVGCRTTKLARVVGLTWPVPAPVFRYYDNTGTLLVGGVGGALTAAQLATISAIEVTLPVRTPGNTRVGPTTIVSRIFLPNSVTG